MSFLSCDFGEEKATASSDPGLINTTLGSQYIDLEGNQINLDDYRGKKVLLKFWASWCKPCVEEMPTLEQLKPFLEKENYVLLLVSEQSKEKIIEFKTRTKSQLDFMKYTGAFSELNIYALPTTFIFNEKGKKVKEIRGVSNWNSTEMKNILKQIN